MKKVIKSSRVKILLSFTAIAARIIGFIRGEAIEVNLLIDSERLTVTKCLRPYLINALVSR